MPLGLVVFVVSAPWARRNRYRRLLLSRCRRICPLGSSLSLLSSVVVIALPSYLPLGPVVIVVIVLSSYLPLGPVVIVIVVIAVSSYLPLGPVGIVVIIVASRLMFLPAPWVRHYRRFWSLPITGTSVICWYIITIIICLQELRVVSISLILDLTIQDF